MRNRSSSGAGRTFPRKTEPGTNRGAMLLWVGSTSGLARQTMSLGLVVTRRLDSWLEAEWTLRFSPALIGEFRAMLSAPILDPPRGIFTISSGRGYSFNFYYPTQNFFRHNYKHQPGV